MFERNLCFGKNNCIQEIVSFIKLVRHYSRGVRNPSRSPSSSRRVFNTLESQTENLRRAPERLPNSRLLQVAILGVPNAGKSTLVNQLSGWKTCSVSKKVHTTRKISRTVLSHNETQIVFLDTPGLVTPDEMKKYNLETSFMIDPERALSEADLFIVLHDVHDKKFRYQLNPKILRLLYLYPDKESVLVLNKVDLIKEKRLLLTLANKLTGGIIGGQSINILPSKSQVLQDKAKEENPTNPVEEHTVLPNMTEQQVLHAIKGKTSWSKFSRLFMISALEGDGISEIMEHLLKSARPSRWIYNSAVVTDQKPQDIALDLVREKLLNLLQKELPYTLKYSIRYWEVDTSGLLDIVIAIDCGKAHTARIVVGVAGRTVVQIARDTEQDLRNIFRSEVRLRLIVEPSTERSPK